MVRLGYGGKGLSLSNTDSQTLTKENWSYVVREAIEEKER